ncbi:transposase [Photobacterium carnosum]|uniref:transposase n=1 Tax=Photobacterium carnosum TaxID=2023717 RepID=UPI0022AB24DF|nr:transposase [Photobacterium carnosum]
MLRTITIPFRNSVRVVYCDLYDGYMNACKVVFNDTISIVADRFHVRNLYRKSLISLRKSELKRLKKELAVGEYAALKLAIPAEETKKSFH